MTPRTTAKQLFMTAAAFSNSTESHSVKDTQCGGVILPATYCEQLMQLKQCRMCRADGGKKKRKESFSDIMPSTLFHYVRVKLHLTWPSALGDFCTTQTHHPLHPAHLHNDTASQSRGSESVRMVQIKTRRWFFLLSFFFIRKRDALKDEMPKMPKSC